MLPFMSILCSIGLFDSQAIPVEKSSLEAICYRNESSMRMRRESFREESTLNVTNGVPILECMSVMDE